MVRHLFLLLGPKVLLSLLLLEFIDCFVGSGLGHGVGCVGILLLICVGQRLCVGTSRWTEGMYGRMCEKDEGWRGRDSEQLIVASAVVHRYSTHDPALTTQA
jgi:hypothetical protein